MNGMTWQTYLNDGAAPTRPKKKKSKRRLDPVEPVEVVTYVEPKAKRAKRWESPPPAYANHVAVATPPATVTPASPTAVRRVVAIKANGKSSAVRAAPAVAKTQGRPKHPLPCGAPCSWSDFWHPFRNASPGEASLSEGIELFCSRHHFGCQREAQRRSDFARQMEQTLRRVFPTSSLHITGSTLNTLFTRNSDLDLACVCRCAHFGCGHDSFLWTSGRKALSQSLHTHIKHIPARCPILQCTTRTNRCAYAFDISFGSLSGVLCNRFLRDTYLHTNPYALPLTAAVKRWALNCGVLDSPNHFLPSHSIVLLVVAFLQRRRLLPRAPYTEKSAGAATLLEGLPGSQASNPSLGALFVAFFEEMAVFPFETTVIGVRADTFAQRATHPVFSRAADIWVVEDPVSPELNVTRNLTWKTAAMIRRSFEEAAVALREWEQQAAPPGPLDLDSFGL